MEFPILSTLTFLPLIGAILIFFFLNGEREVVNQNARQLAFWISTVTFLLSVVLMLNFDMTTAQMQFVEKLSWIPAFNIHYHMGVDGISVLFVMLTALLTPLCILVSWKAIQRNVKGYMAAFLMLESFVIGVFCALDMVLFYVFWEAMLIPMFIIIGVWGGENRVYASLKFFLYTFLGSVLMLVAMLYMYGQTGGSFDITALPSLLELSPLEQKLIWLAFFAAFAVKVPMWPVHTWLPDAHVQAPTAGSVILAGVLLKMGAYGFLRFSMPMLPEASALFAPMVFWLSATAVVYTALVALMQTDIKKMIAYSSVSHMGFVTLGIFAATQEAVQGAILQMVNHGVVSAALFMLIGVIYERMHTRDIVKFGGLVKVMPVYALVMMFFTMAAVGLPGTNNFVGEFMILAGSYPVAQHATSVAILGVLLGACYMLWLYKRMVFGEIGNREVARLDDMDCREKWMFAPLIVLVIWIGLLPAYFLNISEASVTKLVADYQSAQPVQTAALDEDK